MPENCRGGAASSAATSSAAARSVHAADCGHRPAGRRPRPRPPAGGASRRAMGAARPPWQAVMQHDAGEHPPDQARPDLRGRLRHRDRQDERQEGRRRRRGRLRRDDPREEDDEADERHRDHGGHLVRRHHRAEHREAGTHHEESSVGSEPEVGPAGELHQEEERERAERTKERHLRIREDRMGQCEHRRNDHGRPDGALDHEPSRGPSNGSMPRRPAEPAPVLRSLVRLSYPDGLHARRRVTLYGERCARSRQPDRPTPPTGAWS